MAYTMDVVGKYPEQAGLLNGIIQAFGFLAFACGPAIGGMLAERYDAGRGAWTWVGPDQYNVTD